MGISILKWLAGKFGKSDPVEVSCTELAGRARELMIRQMAYHTCINLIANAISKCEFKTFVNNKPVKQAEYFLWNFQPNSNENSTIFLHKLVHKLYNENEVLIIARRDRRGQEQLIIADQWTKDQQSPDAMCEYIDVVVQQKRYEKRFKENEVLHIVLNHTNIKSVLDGLYDIYSKLINTSINNYKWNNGKHYKVHVSQIPQGDENFAENFAAIINKQVKPWLDADNGVLPEFDGYEYVDMSASGKATAAQRSTRDIRALVDDIVTFTANAFGIPPVLILGDVAGTQDAMTRWLTTCIDPLCDQISEEITRKRYGQDQWRRGNFLRIDTSHIIHFDLFENAGQIEKLIGSGGYSINEVRVAAGQDEIDADWANKHFLTLNIGNISDREGENVGN